MKGTSQEMPLQPNLSNCSREIGQGWILDHNAESLVGRMVLAKKRGEQPLQKKVGLIGLCHGIDAPSEMKPPIDTMFLAQAMHKNSAPIEGTA
ncbi:hypothetical protein [Jannaschia helgolandensis]|uniref:hypothetical protein n=1 Tax=Jannaschia helgolandensis TaxID=188906 RepID=UPI0030DA134B